MPVVTSVSQATRPIGSWDRDPRRGSSPKRFGSADLVRGGLVGRPSRLKKRCPSTCARVLLSTLIQGSEKVSGRNAGLANREKQRSAASWPLSGKCREWLGRIRLEREAAPVRNPPSNLPGTDAAAGGSRFDDTTSGRSRVGMPKFITNATAWVPGRSPALRIVIATARSPTR